MNEVDFSRAVSRFLENDLSSSEEQELLQAIQADPRLREAFLSHVRLSVRLQAAAHPPQDRRLVERTQSLLGARDQGQPLRTLEAVQRRIGRRAQSRRWTGWVALAAAVLLAILGLIRFLPDRVVPPVVEVRTKPEPRPQPLPTPRVEAPTPTPAPVVEPPKEQPKPIVVPEEPKPRPEPVPAPPVPPEPPPKVEPPRTPVETRVAVATVESLAGEAFLVTPAGRKPLRAGHDLLAGEGVQTAAGGKAAIVFADKTRLDAGGGTTVRGIQGKKLHLERGTLRAHVVPQPAGQAVEVTTPHGEARVIGTVFRLMVDGSTRLEVSEGKVQIKRPGDAKAVDVAAGEYAVASADRDPVSYPNPLVIDLNDFGNGRDAEPATGPVRRLYRDVSLRSTGGTCIAAPGVGTSLEGALPLTPGAWHLWIRYRDTDQGPVSFQVGVDGKLVETIVGEGYLKKQPLEKWNWHRVSFESKAKNTRLTFRSTSEAQRYDKGNDTYIVVNRWDSIVLTRDPQFDPEKNQ